jgi:rod shape-determining protein MreC
MSPFLRKHQGLIIASLLIGLAISSYSSNLSPNESTPFLRRAALNIYSPPLRAISFFLKGLRHLWEDYIFLLDVQKGNLELQKSLDLLGKKNMRIKEVLLENNRLRKLLLLRERSSEKLISAEIIGRDPVGWFKTILINKGDGDGIKGARAVIAHQGIVGRILDVAADTSKVLLITDINSSVDALVQRTRARGIVEGRTSSLCELKYVSSSDDVMLGDLVVTSGLCGIFPKGLPIGTVSRIKKNSFGLFQHVELTPSASLNRLEEVSILLAEHN